MAEATLDLRGAPRAAAYAQVDAHLDAVLEGITDRVAIMSTMSAVLHHAFGFLWTGFYQVAVPGRQLVVGPYQGTLGCLTIEFGRGVCGRAAETGRTIVVPDVQEFPDHIVCDARAQSEIVVPVFGPGIELIAVLDIDSETKDTFGDEDAAGLEMLVQRFARLKTGYSDRINHALAFAAKHHDQQVRRGTRLPYVTAAPNVAVILSRYGRDDDTVVAGVLRDVVQDYVRDGAAEDVLNARVGEKFGAAVLDALSNVVERRNDDEYVELSSDERRADLLDRIGGADERGKWVIAAVMLHAAGTLLADLSRTSFPDDVVSQANALAGGDGALPWFHNVYIRLVQTGFEAPIMDELGAMIATLGTRSLHLPKGAPRLR